MVVFIFYFADVVVVAAAAAVCVSVCVCVCLLFNSIISSHSVSGSCRFSMTSSLLLPTLLLSII